MGGHVRPAGNLTSSPESVRVSNRRLWALTTVHRRIDRALPVDWTAIYAVEATTTASRASLSTCRPAPEEGVVAGGSRDPGHARRRRGFTGCSAGSYPSALVRISSVTRAMNSSRGMTSCFFPSPRFRTATVPASASRSPTTPMYGIFSVSASRMR